jgi:glucose-1-phosphate thymidylyltransferase
MKAVIFAAGKGERMLPLTLKTCKPMLRVHNIPILERILLSLPDKIDEVIIVVGYFQKQICEHFGDNFMQMKIRYVVQDRPQGTWDALCLVKEFLKEEINFLVLNADDLHSRLAMENLLKYENAILVAKHNSPEKFGVVGVDVNNNLQEIEEKPESPKSNLVSVGVYVLSPKIFACAAPEPINGELFLPRVLNEYCKIETVKVLATDFWVPIGNPQEYIQAHLMV